MAILNSRFTLAAAMLLSMSASFADAIAQESSAATTAPDATLSTSYYLGTGYKNVYYFVCGSTQETDGCYASGALGPFVHAGALIEGNAHIEGNSVIRDIYVVDIGNESATSEVELYVYKKIDIVTA